MTKDNEADKEGASAGVVLERIVSCADTSCRHHDTRFDDNCGGSNMETCIKAAEMRRFDMWSSKNLHGIYKPIVKTKNGRGYTNEYLNRCWEAWQAAVNL